MKKTLQLANAIALIGTIVINYLSNTGIFNEQTMASVSARYQNLFTPAGYAFSIWGLIYAGLIAFIIFEGRSLQKNNDDGVVLQIGWWFVISCLANCAWVMAWLYDYIGLSVIIMILILFSLLQIITRLNMELKTGSFRKKVFTWWPFSIYAGWISVALIANIAAWLTKLKWNGWGIAETSWAIIMICVAGALNLYITWNRNMRSFAFVGIWALVAIAAANWNQARPVALTALVTSFFLVVNIVIQYIVYRRKHPELNKR